MNEELKTQAEDVEVAEKKDTSMKMFFRRLSHRPLAMGGLVVFILIILLAVFADVIAPYDWQTIDVANKFARPSWEHLLGTDQYGRDIFSRLIYGGRWSLTLGIGSTFVGAILGIIVGSIAGYCGGAVDSAIMRFTDVVQCIPGTLMTLCIACVLGSGLFNTVLAMSFGGIWSTARFLRGNILVVRKQEYVEAAKATNVSHIRTIIRYILPNSIQPTLLNLCMNIGVACTSAAGLAFLGLGIQQPYPEWGAMLNDGRTYLRYYPNMLLGPIIMMALLVMSTSFLGDGIRDAMDPRMTE